MMKMIEEITDELIRRGYRVTMPPKGNNPCQESPRSTPDSR